MLRLAFAGTPDFATCVLDALVAAGHQLVRVLTRPDRPAGRGRALVASPVKQRALSLGLEVWQPDSLRDPAARERLAADRLDAMVVAAYGLILPVSVLSIPRFGCLNVHASLLPRWRGAAPIQRAIEAGDDETGVSIMLMDAGLDTGPVLSKLRTPIFAHDTGGTLQERLATLGARALVDALAALEQGELRATPQPDGGATYAHKLSRSDAQLDFAAPARVLVDRIRAFDPVPGASALLERPEPVPIKLWRACAIGDSRDSASPGAGAALGANRPAGTVLRADDQGLLIACDGGAIAAIELQKPGGRRLACEQFLRGFPIAAGERFMSPATN